MSMLKKVILILIAIIVVDVLLLYFGFMFITSNSRASGQYLSAGLSLYNQGKYLEAFDCYEKAWELSPNNPAVYLDAGLIFMKLDAYDRAIELNKRAIELYPRYGKAYGNLGYSYMQDGQPVLAQEMFDYAIDISPKNSEAYLNRGIVHLYNKDYNSAAVDFDDAIKYNNKNTSAYVNRGYVYHVRGHYEQAAECYKKAIDINAYTPWAAHNLNLAKSKKPAPKMKTSAKQQYPPRKKWDGKSITPLKPDILSADASIKFDKGRYKEAIDQCNTAITLDPENALAYLVRGAALIKTSESVKDQNFTNGVKDLQKGHKLFPEYISYYMHIGNAYYRMRRLKDARDAYKTFLNNTTADAGNTDRVNAEYQLNIIEWNLKPENQ